MNAMNAGYGLAVRWSLKDAPDNVADSLREYVVGTSIARFMFLDGLAFKVWRMKEGRRRSGGARCADRRRGRRDRRGPCGLPARGRARPRPAGLSLSLSA